MNCHCCNKNYVSIGNYFQCSNCEHKYYQYKNPINFHAEQYRSLSSSQRIQGEFVNGRVTEKFHQARKEIVKKRLSLITHKLSYLDLVLDIGSGGGTFAKEIEPFVRGVECLELDKMLTDECVRLGFNTYCTDFVSATFHHKYYDVVTCWHVLEHIDDVNEFLEKVNFLNPKLFVVEVPINRRFPRNPFDGHLHMFNEQSFMLILRKNFPKYTIQIETGIQKPALVGIISK